MALEPSQIRNYKGQFAGGWGVEWVGLDLLADSFVDVGTRVIAQRREMADRLAVAMEEYAKQSAPWDDRTGDARSSLQSAVVHGEQLSTVWLSYGAAIFYGYYLENYTYSGVSYAIIRPTIEHFAQQLPSELSTVKL